MAHRKFVRIWQKFKRRSGVSLDSGDSGAGPVTVGLEFQWHQPFSPILVNWSVKLVIWSFGGFISGEFKIPTPNHFAGIGRFLRSELQKKFKLF
jgi:hypothetical protein